MSASPAPGFRYSGKARHRMGYDEVKRLAESYGLPGDAIAQIAKGESGMYADVQQKDPGDGMVGYGLLQMTPNAWGKGSAAYKHMQSLGGIEAMKDPNKNMAMARFLYKSAGNKLTPWYGTKFLTNRSGEGKLGPVNPNLAKGAGDSPTANPKTTTTPGTPADTQARNSAILNYFQSDRGKPGAVLALKSALDAAKGVPGVDVAAPAGAASSGSSSGSPARSASGARGKVTITGPNPGRIVPGMMSFAEKIAGVYGKPLTGSDGSGHSRLTTSGNVSEHTTGHAVDFPATGKELIRMGRAALIAAGMPAAQANKQTGGLFNVVGKNGVRHQIIFNSHIGGDHTNHLHASAAKR